jgi:hypothetical protein
MSLKRKSGLPDDIDSDRYLHITVYYDPESNSCYVAASKELDEEDIMDILASGLESITGEPPEGLTRDDDDSGKGYLN